MGCGWLGAMLAGVAVAAPASPASGDSAGLSPSSKPGQLVIDYPFEGAVFPPNAPPPRFFWHATNAAPEFWRIRAELGAELGRVQAVVERSEWRPDPVTWERMQQVSTGHPVEVVVSGSRAGALDVAEVEARVSFSTSTDPVDAPIFYRDVNLPFIDAVKDPSDIRWRLGRVSDTNPPPVVLERMPVCGNCHSFSQDGRVLGMDVDYANSKGSYVITPTAREMALVPKDVITWDAYRREDGEQTFGLLSQISPDGRWVISTVKDKSVFVPMPDLAFSQLFFPIRGILALYQRETGQFQPLAGADDPTFVQSNPTWSPDGRVVVFARAPAYDLANTAGRGKVLLTPEECREFTQEGKPFRFDLYRIPFNEGRGGRAEPLVGASEDGYSHYFPKFSPDGRWIVFCRARSYMLLQPDSELFIIPAAGGEARRLRCNLRRMNSWHSWSPNGRWMVFSSKAFSDYTQLFLTHMDAEGESAPPILLEQFTATNRAANIPEFVNLPAPGIARIEARFLNDYSIERAGNAFYRAGDPDGAMEKFREALALNPDNAGAHQRLGFLLYHVKREFAEGLAHTREALRLEPGHSLARSDLAMVLLNQGQAEEAIRNWEQALETLPRLSESPYLPQTLRLNLGRACLQLSRFADARRHLEESVRLDPGNAEAAYLLSLSLACLGDVEDARRYCRKAVELQPAIDTSVTLHEVLGDNLARTGRWAEAIQSAEQALRLARAAAKHDLAKRIEVRLEQYRAQVGAGR